MEYIRVASYNIHRCIGTDGRYLPGRIREVLHSIKPDVIALQEVESGQHHGELLEYLTLGSRWQAIEGPTLIRNTGRYGNAILTSLPVISHRSLDLSYKDREPRGALDLCLDYNGKTVRIIATHLGLRPGERRHQVRKLLDWAGAPQNATVTTTLLLGDLNEWFLWGRPLRWLRSLFGAAPAPRTFPSGWPVFALDRIWTSPRQHLVKTEVPDSPVIRLASDHRPVIATLKLP